MLGAASLSACAGKPAAIPEGQTPTSIPPTTTVPPTTTTATTTPPTTTTPTTTAEQTEAGQVAEGFDEASISRVPSQFGTHMPGIIDWVPTTSGRRTLALTFDACGGGVDHALIHTLREHHVPATLFLAQPWIHAHPQLTAELAADPLFQIENHGTRHVPLTVAGQPAYGIHGTASGEEAWEEIMGNATTLKEFGVESTWFRAGTAHYDDVAVDIAARAGMRIAGFHTNGDFGASASPAQVAHQVMHAPDGAIVLAHMNHPHSGTAAGVRQALEHMLVDATFTTLS